MDKRQKRLLTVIIFAVIALPIVTTEKKSFQALNTPLYVSRMERAGSKMNFLPTEKNILVYTAEIGFKLNSDIRKGSYSNSKLLGTCPDTQCGHTCLDSCGYTCEEKTCELTCYGFFCIESVGDTRDQDECVETNYTCHTCRTCHATCNQETCITRDQDECVETNYTCHTCRTCHATCNQETCITRDQETCGETICMTCEVGGECMGTTLIVSFLIGGALMHLHKSDLMST